MSHSLFNKGGMPFTLENFSVIFISVNIFIFHRNLTGIYSGTDYPFYSI
ncbi:hypothetical protein HMPREF9439_00803 [Parasutterella excrementihominis YIT 11859]|uniref:Uncharacterized protein n=1 Tax=Parasutterella excrementihominis YIT 11859 TaxID=762966 RepID=F3QIQ3_9BURK|nr:hypothetical protein HMPREF9439_00803 [Parasutterella excrementihominis YIT 11859]